MPKKYRVIDPDMAASLRHGGAKLREIAALFDVTPSAVQDLLKRRGLFVPRPHHCSSCRARGLLTDSHLANQCPGG
jgi:hypothetical protein